jgi:ArsR family transcriptional regulator, lead/cadmium/zinc/bismuth-responsive transcriptional repressor
MSGGRGRNVDALQIRPARPGAVRTFARTYGCLIVGALTDDRDTCELLCLDLPTAEGLRRTLPRVEQLEALAAGARALAEPTRLAIAIALRAGERACVCDLAWVVGRDDKLVSHHVRLLKAAGLACSERDGKMVLYELTERGRALVSAVLLEQTRA